MGVIGWLLAVLASAAAGYFFVRLRDERASNQSLRNERMLIADEIEELRNSQSRLVGSVPWANVGEVSASVARELDPPLDAARNGLKAVNDHLDEYRRLVRNYDGAVQYCLQPVEMMFGADQEGLDQLVKHVEEARRRLFSARTELEKSPLLNETKAMLAKAQTVLDRSTRLTRSLRQLSRPDSEGIRSVEVSEMIDAALNVLIPVWGDRIVVVREYAELPAIECMSAQISRVFLNVLDNAGLAIEGRGRISIETRMVGARHVEVRISDSGAGIDRDLLANIFDPFVTTRENALGLGLSIAQAAVKGHGGSITVRSSGEGTIIVVSLPIAAAAMAAATHLPILH